MLFVASCARAAPATTTERAAGASRCFPPRALPIRILLPSFRPFFRSISACSNGRHGRARPITAPEKATEQSQQSKLFQAALSQFSLGKRGFRFAPVLLVRSHGAASSSAIESSQLFIRRLAFPNPIAGRAVSWLSAIRRALLALENRQHQRASPRGGSGPDCAGGERGLGFRGMARAARVVPPSQFAWPLPVNSPRCIT